MRSPRSPGRIGIRIALPLALVALLVAVARRDRQGSVRPPADRPDRERIVAVPRDVAVAAAAAAATGVPPDALAEIRDAEARLNRAREDLDGVRRDIEARQGELERLRDDADADARRSREEMERARQDLEKRRDELEEAARDADRRLQAARDEMAAMERRRREQLEAAAGAGVARGLGAGMDVPAGLDPRLAQRGRMPPLVPDAAVVAAAGARGVVPTVVQGQPGMPAALPQPATPGAAALRAQAETIDAEGRASLNSSQAAINARTAAMMALKERLVATEVFFERRRTNRAARAEEAGPRPSLEQVIRCAAAARPPRLDGVQLDRTTGDIAWPQVLTDPVYRELTDQVAAGFRERASWGGSPGFTADETLTAAIDALVDALRSNVSRYPSGRYGEARVFLDSLRAEVYGYP